MEINYQAIECVLLAVIAVLLWRGQSITINNPPPPAIPPFPEFPSFPEFPKPEPVQVKVILPCDIETAKAESRRVRVEQRQPDGGWHPIGETDIDNEVRLQQELAADGRRLVFPDGTVQEVA